MSMNNNEVSHWKDNANKIWEQIDRGGEYNWKIKPKAREILKKFITSEEYANIFDKKNNDESINRSIRPILSKYLLNENTDRKTQVAIWIVAKWGGIGSGKEAIDDWVQRLGCYSPEKIELFMSQQGMRRVSSWSKILAFYDHDKHAIYDSRTSISLNCALSLAEIDMQFIMPKSRNTNKNMIEANEDFKKNPREKLLGYKSYINLLRVFVEKGYVEDILEAEMKLFSNTELIAELYKKNKS